MVIWHPLLPWLQAWSCTAGSSVGRGFEGRIAVAERKKEGAGSCIIQMFWVSPVFSQNSRLLDRVEWQYLFHVLNKFGLSPDFVDWIKLLYPSPLASVSTNSIKSRLFSLHRGARQGCPHSPLLFALAVKPLAIWLQSENRFEGITCHWQLHKISFYADDLLLYMSNPASSLPIILDMLEKFWKYSGYKLNLGKMITYQLFLPLTILRMVSLPLGRPQTVLSTLES